MINIGEFNSLTVDRKVDFGFYLTDGDENDVLLPLKYAPEELDIGHEISVFVYTDSKDRPVAVTTTPLAIVNDMKGLKVKEITGIGAFMDWGLEKDLLVPVSEQRIEMNADETYVVKVLLDEGTQRVYGTSRIEPFLTGDVRELMEGKQVDLLIYGRTKLGYLAVVNQNHSGILYYSEVFEKLKMGDERKGYIKKIRNDEKIDLSIRREGFLNAIEDSTDIVLEKLSEAEGFLPYHDKSSPEDISRHFKISKKAFKKAIGTLYKAGDIIISEKGITLRK